MEGVWAPGGHTQQGKDCSDGDIRPCASQVPNTPAEADLPPGSATNQLRPGWRLQGASQETSGGHVTSTCDAIVGPLFRRKCLWKAAGAELSGGVLLPLRCL